MSKLVRLLLVPFAVGHASLADPASPSTAALPAPEIIGLRTVDLDGELHRLGMSGEPSPVALVFLGTTCPVSNRFVPELNELARAAAEEGAEFFGVISDPAVSAAAARAHRDEYELGFPVLFDGSGELARRLAPTHVPEAFVIDVDDRVRYRGRIDDRFVAVGTLRKHITSHDLRDALEAVLENRSVAAAHTDPVGCVFEAWDTPREGGELTYNRDVAPILNANCVECHRAGDIAPFALDTYAEAKRRAKMIALVTNQRSMPPWQAEPDAGHFRDERLLSREQINILVNWAKAGAPEGDPAERLPAPAFANERWRLGEPDLLVEMPVDFEVAAEGDDVYRYFVVPSTQVQDRAIVAIDFRPGDPSVVHHCIAYMDRSGVALKNDLADERPGFSVFGEEAVRTEERWNPNGLNTSEQIAGWAPGTQPYVLPEGTARLLEAGGDFVLEVHYHKTGKATTDRSALALYFADGEVEHYTQGLVMGTENIDIPAGEADYWRHAWMEVPTDVDLLEVSPHMHYLGKSVEVTATLPDGSTEPLIRIDDWDFRWQGAYFYRQPLSLPAGSRIDAYFRFDNSAENPFNPSSPPMRVKEGWRTTDEMCLFYFTVVPHEAEDRTQLYRAMFASFMRSGDPE